MGAVSSVAVEARLSDAPAWHHRRVIAMKRLQAAPNLALATLWADQLSSVGVHATVQRAFAASIAGQAPPDQCLPEIWVDNDEQLETARTLLAEWQHLPQRRWACRGCLEIVEGPFDCCWNCGVPFAPAGA
jgi:Putative prokaryotic signal transducing protein